MTYRNLNVLVVSGGGFQGLTLIKCLKLSGDVRIIMVNSSNENISKYFVDSFHIVPRLDKKNEFLNSLFEICEKENIAIIIPSTELELSLLSENLNLFKNKNIYVAVSEPGFLKIIKNKHTLYELLIEEGFSTLPILDIKNKRLEFPIIGKPIYGWGSKSIIVLYSYNDIKKYKLGELKENYIWQPLLRNFEEFSVDCAINFTGKVSDIIIRKRIKIDGGFSTVSENVNNSKIKKMVVQFLNFSKSRGARGIFNIQILKDGRHYFFSDINPRIGTSAIFSSNLGVNLPLFLCSYINPNVYPINIEIGNKFKKLKMVRYLEELWIEKGNFDDIKGIVFDLDDVLINQKLWIVDKLEMLWEMFSTILPPKSKFLLEAIQIIEEGNRGKVFDALAQKFGFDKFFKKTLIKTYRKIEPLNAPLFPDVLPTLKELRKTGFKLALLTDNPPESQEQKIKVCNLREHFDIIVYSRKLSQEKPSKEVFREVTNLLNLPAQSLIMVGDNLYRDIVGSQEAGYKFGYWIVREGTFFNFEQKLLDRVSGSKYNFKKISTLKSLLWDLG